VANRRKAEEKTSLGLVITMSRMFLFHILLGFILFVVRGSWCMDQEVVFYSLVETNKTDATMFCTLSKNYSDFFLVEPSGTGAWYILYLAVTPLAVWGWGWGHSGKRTSDGKR
jgi:hypothetical protein